ncbi:hypothetical protein HMPREF0476_1450 [Kingella kingae ATCC 23330]|uniref:Uncharacterized protein n=1 Tax=Kingella kingae ATCC 23330 TaxID=887327 RepID=F5S8B9_KINKI|nr:hypothetical protein HMPREF0476_1450 [Kingella kingae ATCC 23330]
MNAVYKKRWNRIHKHKKQPAFVSHQMQAAFYVNLHQYFLTLC